MTEAKVYSAILAITEELRKGGIKKDKEAGGGQVRYAYRGIEAVYAALSPLLPKYHVVISPVRIEKEPDSTAGKMRLVRIKVTYQITSTEDGSHFCVESLGEGVDSQDKAAGKAMSYAYKSLMFQLFCIPVAGTPDPDDKPSPPAEQAHPFVSNDLVERNRAAANTSKEAWVEFWKSCTKEERETLRASGEVDLAKKIIEAMQGGLP